MKEYYKIMEDILEVEYRIRATVYVLDELEKSYSEETDFKEKYLLSVFKGALSSIQSKRKQAIGLVDKEFCCLFIPLDMVAGCCLPR